jgi:hypothetical protein
MTSYPEKIPASISPIKNFYFNLENSKNIKGELESQIHSLDERIEKIVEHFTLDDVPIIKFILNVSHDKGELKKISKALDRVADLIEARDKILPKLQVIKTAESDPNWFALAFGSFAEDIELEIENILYNGDTDV